MLFISLDFKELIIFVLIMFYKTKYIEKKIECIFDLTPYIYKTSFHIKWTLAKLIFHIN